MGLKNLWGSIFIQLQSWLWNLIMVLKIYKNFKISILKFFGSSLGPFLEVNHVATDTKLYFCYIQPTFKLVSGHLNGFFLTGNGFLSLSWHEIKIAFGEKVLVMCSTFKWLVVIVSKSKRDLIETGIAPLSKKLAVKCLATVCWAMEKT